MTGLLRAVLLPGPAMRAAGAVMVVLMLALLAIVGSMSAGKGWFPSPLDKLVHAAYYGGIGAWAWVALGGRDRIAPWGAVLLVAACGAADEFVQAYTPGRYPSALDWSADILGAAVAVLILGWLRSGVAARQGREPARP